MRYREAAARTPLPTFSSALVLLLAAPPAAGEPSPDAPADAPVGEPADAAAPGGEPAAAGPGLAADTAAAGEGADPEDLTDEPGGTKRAPPLTLPAGAVPVTPVPAAATPGTQAMPWEWLGNPLASRSRGARGRKRTTPHRFLPLPSVRSQPSVGLMFGASLNYAYRTRDDDPNRVYLYFESRVSLRKVQEHGLFLRLRDVLGYGEVIEVGGTAVIDPVVPYFGVANNANLRGENLQGPYYQTSVGTFGGFFTYQHPLWTLKQGPGRPVGYLRTYTGFGYYADRIRPYEDSLFAAERPYDAGLTRRGQLRVGLTWDRRDNEWSPRRGALHDVTFDAAGPWTGSTHAWGRVSASLRHYWQLGVPSFVLAHRVTFDSLWGDPPFMPLGEFGGLVPTDGFGGSNAGRGWIRRRYIGRHKAFASLELRFEPLEFKIRRKYIGLGIKGYVDLGLVAQTMSDMLVHWHVSGGPGVLLIWDRFAVIRVDGGFSRETSGFYLQTEHAF